MDLNTVFDFTVNDDNHGTVYTPWTDGHAIGFRAVHTNGVTEYIYLNPSTGDNEDDLPRLFLYVGESGKPDTDSAAHFYNLNDGW